MKFLKAIMVMCLLTAYIWLLTNCNSASRSNKTRADLKILPEKRVEDVAEPMKKPEAKNQKQKSLPSISEKEISQSVLKQKKSKDFSFRAGDSKNREFKKESLKKMAGNNSMALNGAACDFSMAAPVSSLCEIQPMPGRSSEKFNTEAYDHIYENKFLKAMDNPLSTFSIDVDAASYSNMRRFLMNNQLPPKDAVRLEEMINYFTYNYKEPEDGHPFSINLEMGQCPWNKKHKLVHIGLQGRNVKTDSLPPGNLVFLLDVSGSMNTPDKLPLLKMALKMLIKKLRKQDRVAIVVYAGAAGEVLPATAGDKKERIISTLENLSAGGSTAGGAGIELAYKIAKQNFMEKGNNRVILATDGDFNVGASSDGDLIRMIEEKSKDNIFLTVLGLGSGNYKDSKMEKLAGHGNGNYAYIDNLLEAKKVLVNEMGGTLLTIAKDVKIQVEFNPAHVQAYRLIGYENRKLNAEDFNDDKKDSGELGAGHSVTALYEIIPVGVEAELPNVDELKYQSREIKSASGKSELLTVKFRYKEPGGTASKLTVKTLYNKSTENLSENFYFSAAVAGFGMLLRESEYKGGLTYDKVIKMAKESKGGDQNGYRAEFIRLIERADIILQGQS
ncbi:MAG: VWA domain-containing protein [bacterium]